MKPVFLSGGKGAVRGQGGGRDKGHRAVYERRDIGRAGRGGKGSPSTRTQSIPRRLREDKFSTIKVVARHDVFM
jgi:hypothetical protein